MATFPSRKKSAFPNPKPSLLEAQRLAKARPGPPSAYDAPPVRPLPGPKPKVLPGQLDIFGNEAA